MSDVKLQRKIERMETSTFKYNVKERLICGPINAWGECFKSSWIIIAEDLYKEDAMLLLNKKGE